MKHYFLALWSVLLLFACEETTDPEAEPTIAEEKLEQIQRIIWVPGTITSDGNNMLEIYPSLQDFKLTFAGVLDSEKTNVQGQYQTEGDIYNILGDGSWEFKEGSEATVLLMNGTEVNYTVSETSLRLDFIRASENSRPEAISGEYTFNLVPEN